MSEKLQECDLELVNQLIEILRKKGKSEAFIELQKQQLVSLLESFNEGAT